MSALLLAKPIGAGLWGHNGAKMIFEGDLEIPIQPEDWAELKAMVDARFAEVKAIAAQERERLLQPPLFPAAPTTHTRDENSPPGDERRTD